MELGARRCCSRSLLCCLWNLGFNKTLAKKTLKTASKFSLESCFCIWLVRDNIVWESFELNSLLSNTPPPDQVVHQHLKPRWRTTCQTLLLLQNHLLSSLTKETHAMPIPSCKHWVLYNYFGELLLWILHNCQHYWSQLR